MPRECPGCGATATPEARFCRRCGAPFRVASEHNTDSPISPMAQTVPLADQGRTTDGLLTEESQQLASGTSRIRRTEMEDMLRRISREHGGDGLSASHPLAEGDGSSPEAVPITSTLQTPSASDSSHNTSSTTTTPAAVVRKPRRWHRWQGAAIILLCTTLAIGLGSFISYRRSSATGTGDTGATAPVSEEKQPDAAAEAVPQPEQMTDATTAPPDTTARPEPSRARAVEAAARPASETPLASTTPTTPVPSLETRQTTTPPAALSASDHYRRGVQLWEGNRRAALEEFRAAAAGGVPDAYYYLGSEYYSEGRDPKTLGEGELRAALNYFLRATSGPHSAQASRAAKTLGKEYERRKKHSRP